MIAFVNLILPCTAKHNILLGCTEESGQYVQYGDCLYRDNWMRPVTTDNIKFEEATVIEIEHEEYEALSKAIESGEDIPVEDEIPVLEETYVDPNEELTLDYVINAKISEMSNMCNTVISNGFDIVLSDGNAYHYSLTVQDQLNLITLSSMIAAGETAIPYHADGELCREYSAEDISLIIDAATQFKTYHITYYNSLKAYIAAMDNISDVSGVRYGAAIPEEFQSEVLKALSAQAEGNGNEEDN